MENFEKIIEILFSVVLTINAAIFIPQIIKLYKAKSSDGLSFLTFFGFNFMQLLGVMHCYYKQDFFPMFGWLASLLTCSTVTIILMYYRTNQ